MTTEEEAKAAGYWPMTYLLNLPEDQPIVDSILSNFRNTPAKAVLVGDADGVVIWRSGDVAGYLDQRKANNQTD